MYILNDSKKIQLKNSTKNDAIYDSFWFAFFIKKIFKNGQKIKIEKHLYKCLYNNRLLFNVSAIFLFFEIIETTKNVIQLEHKKSRGANSLYPKPVLYLDQYKKAINTLTKSIKVRDKFSIIDKLTRELQITASKKQQFVSEKAGMNKLCFKNHSRKNYRWHI